MLFLLAAKRGEAIGIDKETLAAVREGREEARRGEFVSDEDVEAFFERTRGQALPHMRTGTLCSTSALWWARRVMHCNQL
jgi:hypothetical protein